MTDAAKSRVINLVEHCTVLYSKYLILTETLQDKQNGI